MNWDRVEGNWEQVKGKVRQTWGKLTDDDMATLKGKRQELTGKLQERYGYAKDMAESEIEKFLGDKDLESSCGCGSDKHKPN